MLLGIAASVLMLVLVWGGIQMIGHGLTETPQKTLENGKFTVTRGMTGLIIIALAYVIVNAVIAVLGGGDINTIMDKFFNPT